MNAAEWVLAILGMACIGTVIALLLTWGMEVADEIFARRKPRL